MNLMFFPKNNLKLMRIVSFVFAVFFLFSFKVDAQNTREEVVQRQLNIGKQLLTEGKYDSAASVLKSAFIKNAVLPDELLYYYSFALFKKGDLDQSKKLVDKFVKLSTPKTELYPKAIELQKSIDNSIDAASVACSHCNGAGYLHHTCPVCEGKGEQKCDVCKGKGKVLVGASYGMRYGMCTSCMGDGIKVCSKCGGKKEVTEVCPICKGKGKVRQ
jgi:tetratricopeptide (TPR) repeat protein